MSELTKLPNIGAEVERQLNAVGITSLEQLKEDAMYEKASKKTITRRWVTGY